MRRCARFRGLKDNLPCAERFARLEPASCLARNRLVPLMAARVSKLRQVVAHAIHTCEWRLVGRRFALPNPEVFRAPGPGTDVAEQRHVLGKCCREGL